MLRTCLVVLAVGIVHFGLAVLAWAGAGMTSSYGGWRTAALVIGFPLSVLPVFSTSDWSLTLWALQSALWGLLFAGAWHAFGVWWGAARQMQLVWLVPTLLVVVMVAVHAIRTPAPFAGWHSVWIDDVNLTLPWVFEPSAAEAQHAEAIAAQIGRLAGDAPSERRWYWNYRSTLSGAPEYDGVAIALDARADAATWLATLTDQRAQLWTQTRWGAVARGSGYVIETSLPNPAPLPQHEHQRLLRIRGDAPIRGFWFGMVVLARKAGPDELTLAWQRATTPGEPTPANAAPALPTTPAASATDLDDPELTRSPE